MSTQIVGFTFLEGPLKWEQNVIKAEFLDLKAKCKKDGTCYIERIASGSQASIEGPRHGIEVNCFSFFYWEVQLADAFSRRNAPPCILPPKRIWFITFNRTPLRWPSWPSWNLSPPPQFIFSILRTGMWNRTLSLLGKWEGADTYTRSFALPCSISCDLSSLLMHHVHLVASQLSFKFHPESSEAFLKRISTIKLQPSRRSKWSHMLDTIFHMVPE